MVLLHIGVLLLLGAMGVVTAINVVGVTSLRKRNPSRRGMVSVLIPARNEEATIGHLLDLLARQEYPEYEILVLDDQSDDRTADVVRQHSRIHPRMTLIEGRPLPPGWVGKAHACAQLAAVSRGEYLLFMDADTQPGPQALSAGVADLERSGADLLTVIPRQRMDSFWERVLMPILHFSTFSYLPVPMVPVTKSPNLAMANGQYMLFRRGAYEEVGGHTAVRDALVEDVWLARCIKRAGRRLVIRYGGRIVSCRMYQSLRGIWEGFSKNVFPGLHGSMTMLAGVLTFTVLTSLLPFLLLAGTLVGWVEGSLWMVMAEVGVVTAVRVAQALRFDMPLWPVLFHPLSMLVFMAIAVNSFFWSLRDRGIQWKGRSYSLLHPPMTP